MTLDVTNDANDKTSATEIGPGDGMVDGSRCFFARPIRIGNDITLGIQAKLSNLDKEIKTPFKSRTKIPQAKKSQLTNARICIRRM